MVQNYLISNRWKQVLGYLADLLQWGGCRDMVDEAATNLLSWWHILFTIISFFLLGSIANFYSRTVHTYFVSFFNYRSIRPDIFPNNVSCFDILFLLFYSWSSFKFFSRAKQKFKILFFCDHNVMSLFWVIYILIKNKSVGLTFFKLQLHNCKKLTIHKLNLPPKKRNNNSQS